MNDGQLFDLLASQSPWREGAGWEQDDPDMRASAEHPLQYDPVPLADIHAPGLYVLRGPRRVGKSLEMKRAIAQLIGHGVDAKAIFFCSCDGLTAQDLRRMVRTAHARVRPVRGGGRYYWFLDEVTGVRDWATAIKQLRDQDTEFREACVVLSGSSARDLAEATKALADRRGGIADSDRLLLPMTFRSFCRAISGYENLPTTIVRPRDMLTHDAEDAIRELEPFATRLDDAWQLYLTIGGFPRAVGEYLRYGEVRRGFIDGLWDVVHGDAIRAGSLSETETAVFMARLATNLCSPVNASTVAQDVGLRDNERVNDRIHDLATAFLAWRCYKLRGDLPNTAAQRKVYFVDPLIAQLPHLRNPSVRAVDQSQLSEQQLGLALNRAVSLDRPRTFVDSDRVMYARYQKEAEIDFVGPLLGVPFESKYEDRPWKQATLTMRAQYGEGVLATRTPLAIVDATGSYEPVRAIPVGLLVWLLGS